MGAVLRDDGLPHRLLRDALTMGLDAASVKFLCAAKSSGVDFRHTATIGRQEFVPDAGSLGNVLRALGIDQDPAVLLRENRYGEAFFSLLGAQQTLSLDYSSYEGADVIQDMNLPIPEQLRERFSVVHDGGTIEHIFNVPQALKNCMEMVRIGGHFTQVNVANNLMGHGFWQFSPELIFRALSAVNGYRIEVVLMHELVAGGAWYVVTDPDEMRGRVGLCNSVPTYILTIAKRVAPAEIFAVAPQQSDYVAAWHRPPPNLLSTTSTDTMATGYPHAVRGLRSLGRHAREPIKAVRRRLLRGSRLANSAGVDQPCYRPISEEALLRGSF